MTRPRKAAADPRTERRRAQYRNAKRRAKGLAPEAVPWADVRHYEPRRPQHGDRHVSVWIGSRWVPALIDAAGRRIFLGWTR